MVQQQVLNQIDDPRLRVFIVWQPMLPGDSEKAATRAMGFVPDARATHFWTPTQQVGRAFAKPLGLKGRRTAWDVYLVYSGKSKWGEAVPVPDSFRHQLGRALPADRRLNGPKLAEEVRKILK